MKRNLFHNCWLLLHFNLGISWFMLWMWWNGNFLPKSPQKESASLKVKEDWNYNQTSDFSNQDAKASMGLEYNLVTLVFYKWGNWASELRSNLPRITQSKWCVVMENSVSSVAVQCAVNHAFLGLLFTNIF